MALRVCDRALKRRAKRREKCEAVRVYLRGVFKFLPLILRTYSTSTLDSLFEHLNTITGDESLLMVLFA